MKTKNQELHAEMNKTFSKVHEQVETVEDSTKPALSVILLSAVSYETEDSVHVEQSGGLIGSSMVLAHILKTAMKENKHLASIVMDVARDFVIEKMKKSLVSVETAEEAEEVEPIKIPMMGKIGEA
jgi:hypothetical protein